jgi:hypothetical protein
MGRNLGTPEEQGLVLLPFDRAWFEEHREMQAIERPPRQDGFRGAAQNQASAAKIFPLIFDLMQGRSLR